MYSQFSSQYVQAELDLKAERVRRTVRPSRRRARALFDAETARLRRSRQQ